jgi:multiple sugar transport system ATP-binding protein
LATVELKDLVKVYARGMDPTVKGVDLTIEDGEFFILLGPSGCGKSTLLRMIAGLESITAGELRIGGRLINRVAPKDRDIAMVFQSYALYPHMTVAENMGFGLKMRGFEPADVLPRIEEAAKTLGLEELLERLPKALSGGQRQRVALGRAIVREPKVFLLDEPLSNLDAKLRGSMRVELKRLHQRLGATMIYVTHDQTEAMTLGDRVAVLSEGKLQQVGSPLDVYDRPSNKFVAGFLGSPPMNFLQGQLQVAQPTTITFESGGLLELPKRLRAAAPNGSQVDLGVRPEDMRLVVGELGPGPLGGTVAVVEPLGAETVVTVDTPQGAVVARVDPGLEVSAGVAVTLAPDMERVHLFSSETGARVGPPPPPRAAPAPPPSAPAGRAAAEPGFDASGLTPSSSPADADADPDDVDPDAMTMAPGVGFSATDATVLMDSESAGGAPQSTEPEPGPDDETVFDPTL